MLSLDNKNCIVRLSRYRTALDRLKAMGFIKVFSDNLADAVDVTPSQVRKDFALFGLTGNKRGGYQIDELIEKLNHILGKNEVRNVIIVGSGNIGQALMKYNGFMKEGIKIIAAFDSDATKINRTSEIPVLPMEEMAEFVKSNNIKVGILAVPDTAATQVYENMVNAGIKGVLNFSPIKLRAKENIITNTVNIGLELENIIYYVRILEKTSGRT
jgi:redox-sensing transcriptional repressor